MNEPAQQIDAVIPEAPPARPDGLPRAIARALLAENGLPLVWIALTILYLYPIWNQRLLPMLDSPNHLALIRGWHSYDDPEWGIQKFFTVRIRPVPYLLFYATVHYLMYLFPIEIANKVFLSAYVVLFPLSVLSLALALKRNPWLAIGAFPLAFNPSWIYGYSSLLLGNVFAFFSLASMVRWLNQGKPRELILLMVLVTCTFFSHILPWFVFGLAAICLLILHRDKWRLGARAILPMLPSVIFALAAIFEESSEHAYIKDPTAKMRTAWRDVPTLVMELPKRILGIFPGWTDMTVLAILVATVLLVWWWSGTRIPGESDKQRRQVPLLMGLLIFLYLALPYQVYGPIIFFQMAQRIPAMAACVFLLIPTGNLSPRRRLAMIPLLIACAVLPIRMAGLYRDFSNRNLPFVRLLNQVPRGKTVMTVVRGMWNVSGGEVAEASGDPVTRGPVYWHFSSWPMALRGAFSPYLFDQGIPIHYKKQLKAPVWNNVDGFDIRQAPEFDYYLIRNAPEAYDREPALHVVDQINEWTLFERLYDLTDEP